MPGQATTTTTTTTTIITITTIIPLCRFFLTTPQNDRRGEAHEYQEQRRRDPQETHQQPLPTRS